MAAYSYIWAFEVRPEHQAEFEHCYGPGGEWEQLFRRADGYIRTLLLKDQSNPRNYLTVDQWRNVEAYRAFRAGFASEYAALDLKCEGWTSREESLGEYDEVNT